MRTPMVIALDGPAGCGKSTVARLVARHLGAALLDTGAIYRALAVWASRHRVATDNAEALARLAQEMNVEMGSDGDQFRIEVNGENLSGLIRSLAAGKGASEVAKHVEVRAALLRIQRAFVSDRDVVAEGRDMGTVVFPDANVKVFLTARPEVRAERRYREFQRGGVETSIDEVLSAQAARDLSDTSRHASPLKASSAARTIDTSDVEAQTVADQIVAMVNAAKKRVLHDE